MSDEKTTTGQALEQESAPVLPMKLDVSVRPIEPKGNLVGFASLKINDSFVIDDFKILQGDKGLFVGMPSNEDLSHLPVSILTEEQLSRYAFYMKTHGNRPDLFPQSQYPNASTLEPYTDYTIPEAYMSDKTFAAMMAEATKYLGYPYVWGGSSPETSFDCSGYVSWVINHSGWNVGRLGAQGLYDICTPIPASEAKPGDLVFFEGTYDTTGVSHVGIYVGDGEMIAAGDPIGYSDITTSYWKSHFYAFGRLPETE